jgi:hypothetical protein
MDLYYLDGAADRADELDRALAAGIDMLNAYKTPPFAGFLREAL